MSRRERLKALNLDRVLILDRGNVELALPRGWTVAHDPQGHLACKDPTDACKLEVSCFALPPLLPTAPSMVERVRLGLEGVADPSTCSPVAAFRRGRAEFAWTDYVFTSEDTERGERREAHGRLLLAANPWFQAVFTFSYWTIEVGDGVPLETPRDHWSLRDA